MPGHILAAQCECGFFESVWPGAFVRRDGTVGAKTIAYDPEKPGLITVETEEAEQRGLECLPNPFIEFWDRPMADPEVQDLGAEPAFRCPQCRRRSMHFHFSGFWD